VDSSRTRVCMKSRRRTSADRHEVFYSSFPRTRESNEYPSRSEKPSGFPPAGFMHLVFTDARV